MEPSLVFRACAIWLLLLAASPVTFPCLTYDPSAPVHDSTPAADASKLKPAPEAPATLRASFSEITGVGYLDTPLMAGLSTGWLLRFVSPVLRIRGALPRPAYGGHFVRARHFACRVGLSPCACPVWHDAERS